MRFISVEVEQETSAPLLKKSWIRPWNYNLIIVIARAGNNSSQKAMYASCKMHIKQTLMINDNAPTGNGY